MQCTDFADGTRPTFVIESWLRESRLDLFHRRQTQGGHLNEFKFDARSKIRSIPTQTNSSRRNRVSKEHQQMRNQLH